MLPIFVLFFFIKKMHLNTPPDLSPRNSHNFYFNILSLKCSGYINTSVWNGPVVDKNKDLLKVEFRLTVLSRTFKKKMSLNRNAAELRSLLFALREALLAHISLSTRLLFGVCSQLCWRLHPLFGRRWDFKWRTFSSGPSFWKSPSSSQSGLTDGGIHPGPCV